MEDNKIASFNVPGNPGLGLLPSEADVAVTSIDVLGNEGFLNAFVLKHLNYPRKALPVARRITSGHCLLTSEGRTPIIFVVTVGEKDTKTLLQDNLLAALNANRKILKGKRVWIPLLGTGAGGLAYSASYNTILSTLKKYCDEEKADTEFLVSIPNDKQGKELFKKVAARRIHAKQISPQKPTSSQKERQKVDEKSGVDKIPFHLDHVETVDRLNREPIAKSLARLLNTEVFKRGNQLNHSFMIHLQGAWGDGKSTFLNLLAKNLQSGDKKWIVVNFNAWQNQHISPPWWTLLTAVYQESLRALPFFKRPSIWVRESWRRLTLYKGIFKLTTLLLSIGFALLIAFHRDAVWKLWQLFIIPENRDHVSGDKDLWEFFTTLGSAIGLLFTFSKFISYPFFVSSPDDAKSFMQHASDPMKKIRNHFRSLISNLNWHGRNVAIMIDDLDRCTAAFTVGLLEGIQTLFKDKAVLYVVAGDRHWIGTCFENNYEKYKAIAREPAQKLGHLFLEKVFQFSFRLPTVSTEAKASYWEYILNPGLQSPNQDGVANKVDSGKEILKTELRNRFYGRDLTHRENVEAVFETFKGKLTQPEAVDLVLELIDESKEDVKHLLRDHHSLIDGNPRSIKRLANQYTITRNILLVEGREYNRDRLFRWLILQNKYPLYTDWLESNLTEFHSGKQYDPGMKGITDDPKWIQLVLDPEMKHGGKLTARDIAIFVGIPFRAENRNPGNKKSKIVRKNNTKAARLP